MFFGILSSLTTACHAIVIKKSLPIVDGSAMDLAWYQNMLSAIVMLPLSIIVGEGPNIAAMWTEEAGVALSRFIWGGAVTVGRAPIVPVSLRNISITDSVCLVTP